MMETKKIQKSIEINAPAEKVWNVLFTDESYRIRAAEFAPGSYAETDWQLGSKAIFGSSADGNGIFGTITTNAPHKHLAITYEGEIVNNKEETETEVAKGMKGVVEEYMLSETENGTHLDIACDMALERFDMMSAAWDKALIKIKELSEQSA